VQQSVLAAQRELQRVALRTNDDGGFAHVVERVEGVRNVVLREEAGEKSEKRLGVQGGGRGHGAE